jgi:hypothetical protein
MDDVRLHMIDAMPKSVGVHDATTASCSLTLTAAAIALRAETVRSSSASCVLKRV